jgi:hypothetical protein
MTSTDDAYGLWGLVLLNSAMFIGFAYIFFRFPGVDLLGHDAGHLWWLLTGRQGDPHFGLPHVPSFVFILAGFSLLSRSWQAFGQAWLAYAATTPRFAPSWRRGGGTHPAHDH